MGCACSRAVDADRVIAATRDELRELYQTSIAQNDGRLIVCGLLHRANSVNNNRRVYPKRILQREVSRYQRTHMRNATALGELDHPSYVSPTFRCLNLCNVSHQVLSLYWEGDNLMGYIEVLQTPAGKLLGELFKSGCQVGVSSRGWASLREVNGWITIQDDFELITFDFVTEPSTQGAFLRPIQGKYRRVPDQKHVTEMSYAIEAIKPNNGEDTASNPGILPMNSNLKLALQSLHRKLGGPQMQKSATSGPHNILEGFTETHALELPHSGINAVLPPHPTKVKPNGNPESSSHRNSGSVKPVASIEVQRTPLKLLPDQAASMNAGDPVTQLQEDGPTLQEVDLDMRLPNMMPVSVA